LQTKYNEIKQRIKHFSFYFPPIARYALKSRSIKHTLHDECFIEQLKHTLAGNKTILPMRFPAVLAPVQLITQPVQLIALATLQLAANMNQPMHWPWTAVVDIPKYFNANNIAMNVNGQ